MTFSISAEEAAEIREEVRADLDRDALLKADRQGIFNDVSVERERQVGKWGPQRHPVVWPDDDSPVAERRRRHFAKQEAYYKEINDAREQIGLPGIWCDILLEELYEALAEPDPAKRRKELIETMAVACAWVEDEDTRSEFTRTRGA